MGKPVPRTSALVVSAIRKLREAQGSTSREIMNYITTEYDVIKPTVKRQLQAALKRGVEYGILTRKHGHYTLSTDACRVPMTMGGEGGLVESCGRKRRKYRKCKKTRRCARGCVRRRRKEKCGKKGRRRRSRRRRCGKRHPTLEPDNLALDCRTRNEMNAERSEHSNRSRSSNSHSRNRSHSVHSTRTGGREKSLDRREKQVE
ncbi:uncharacterized protein LOC124179782 [Neodiprion fabricii]|uniref:uncharacterized protein LOC124179782 n=1 Tax=Neodiprion fabricii TaxID=2872261 RepID=UPI001ED93E09|nr:uncharacterized protein LOC124179782 [Neodiprion fabricii]